MIAKPSLFRPVGFALVACSFAGSIAHAEHRAIVRAERAIENRTVDPERHIGPLLEALQSASSVDEKQDLVDAIADLGEADGESPNAVKSYLVAHAPPVLFEVIEHGGDPFLQGSAVTALRGMAVPRSVLERAADLAEADPNSFVQSRGEILRNFIRSMPVEDESAVVLQPKDDLSASAGIAYLDQRGITVSTQSLRDAAMRADPVSVNALLLAGVPVDTGVDNLSDTPLGKAVSGACTQQGAETDWLIETVQRLVDAGADLSLTDDNDNTALNLAVHWCGPRITALLVEAGVELEKKNGSGLSALALALVTQKLDSAEVLVEAGARLSGDELTMAKSAATDPRGQELVRRAGGRPIVEAVGD